MAAREKAKEERVRPHPSARSISATTEVEANLRRQAARLQAQREQREAEIAAQDALLAMDVSTVEDGATLSSIVGQRAKARADLAPYRWGDLNKFASKRTLGRAERAANGARLPDGFFGCLCAHASFVRGRGAGAGCGDAQRGARRVVRAAWLW